MSVKLRLTRLGRKKSPFYRIVAIDSRKSRNGLYLERVGTYNPLADPAVIDVNHETAIKWLGNGAQPSNTVRTLLSRTGVLLRWDLMKRDATPEQIEEAVAAHCKTYSDKADKADAARQAKADALRKTEEDKAAKEATAAEAKARAEVEAEAKAKAESEAKAAAEAPAEDTSAE